MRRSFISLGGLFLSGATALTGCGPAGPQRLATENVALSAETAAEPAESSMLPAATLPPAVVEVTEPMSPELAAIPASVREEIDLFANATLQIQRVKLLQERGLQRDYQLTAPQVQALAAVNAEVETLSTSLQRLRPEERQQKLRHEYRLKAEEFATLVNAQLNASQQQLLFQEVVARQRGAIVLLLPGVPEELSLTDAQRARLYQIVEVTRNSVDFDNLYNPLELARLVRRATAARQEAEGLLTPTQAARFAALIGK